MPILLVMMAILFSVVNCVPRVAIIGGGLIFWFINHQLYNFYTLSGIGGASSGYFISQLLPNAEITIYEKDDIGGRLAIQEVNGRMYEYGGCIIHGENKLMVDYLNLCGLKKNLSPKIEPMTLHSDGQIVFQVRNICF